ncbi:MAG: peptidase M15 [Bryobacterales bacterium]|nr:peptidase M15 [Bryobacterales bacterium]
MANDVLKIRPPQEVALPRSLSEHFTLEEMTLSQTAAREGIDNKPSPEIVKNLKETCALLEAVRKALGGVPVLISSGYRSAALNKAVGGSKTSAHMEGFAADFTAPAFGTPLQVARAISASGIAYDQLIHEFAVWVHIGLRKGAPRKEDLSIFSGTGYLKGLRGKP